MEKKNLEHWASLLHNARLKAQPLPQISKNIPDFTRADAYSIQEQQLWLREFAGEHAIGWKMGLTSEAKRKQMNLDSPLYGVLTDKMLVTGSTFSLKNQIHPKIEPEIAFHITKDLKGNVTREQVLDACGGVAACMEILDSRYEQFKYFSMEDVIADNSSSSHFVLGEWNTSFHHMDLANLTMIMTVNNELAQKGHSRDISGDPVMSVVELCRLLAERDHKLKAGSLVLAGAATPAVELKPGMEIVLKVDHMMPVSVRVTEE